MSCVFWQNNTGKTGYRRPVFAWILNEKAARKSSIMRRKWQWRNIFVSAHYSFRFISSTLGSRFGSSARRADDLKLSKRFFFSPANFSKSILERGISFSTPCRQPAANEIGFFFPLKSSLARCSSHRTLNAGANTVNGVRMRPPRGLRRFLCALSAAFVVFIGSSAPPFATADTLNADSSSLANLLQVGPHTALHILNYPVAQRSPAIRPMRRIEDSQERAGEALYARAIELSRVSGLQLAR